MKTKNKIQHLILAGLLGTTIASQGAVIYTHTYGLNATDVDGGALDSATETWTHNVTNIDGSGVSFDLVLTAVATGGNWSVATGSSMGVGGGRFEPGESGAFTLSIENLVGIDVSKLYYAMTIHGLSTDARGGTDSGTFTLINGVAPSSTLTWVDSNANPKDFIGHTGSFNLPLMNAAYGDGSDVTSFTHAAAGASWSFFSQGVEFAVVPEPSSTALLGLGGLALMLRRKRS